MNKKIESLYQDYKELRYLGKDFNEAINEFTFLKPFELVEFKRLIENRENIRLSGFDNNRPIVRVEYTYGSGDQAKEPSYVNVIVGKQPSTKERE